MIEGIFELLIPQYETCMQEIVDKHIQIILLQQEKMYLLYFSSQFRNVAFLF